MGKVRKAIYSVVTPKKSKENKLSGFKKEDSKKKKGKKSHVLKVSNPMGITRRIISKKEKQKFKSQKIKEKLELTKEAFKEDKRKKKREKTAIVGDLKPLLDSLPSLDELLTLREKSSKTGIAAIDRKIPNKPKTKTARREQMRHDKTEKMLDRFDHVQKIWKSPEFQKDPRKLIAEQIRKRRQANEMEN